MKSEPDEIDQLCLQWASLARRRCGLETPGKQGDSDALASLRTALVKLEGATTGPALGPSAILHGAFARMPRGLARLVQLHYLFPMIATRLKAKLFDTSQPAFYARLDTGKAFLRGYLGAARVEMADGVTGR